MTGGIGVDAALECVGVLAGRIDPGRVFDLETDLDRVDHQVLPAHPG